MMDYITICGLCVVCAVVSLTLKRYNPEVSLLVSIAAGVVIALQAITIAKPALGKITSLLTLTSLESNITSILFKSLGVCFLCQFASDSCEDAGEKALASKVQLIGKISVLVMSLPLVEQISEIALGLIES